MLQRTSTIVVTQNTVCLDLVGLGDIRLIDWSFLLSLEKDDTQQRQKEQLSLLSGLAFSRDRIWLLVYNIRPWSPDSLANRWTESTAGYLGSVHTCLSSPMAAKCKISSTNYRLTTESCRALGVFLPAMLPCTGHRTSVLLRLHKPKISSLDHFCAQGKSVLRFIWVKADFLRKQPWTGSGLVQDLVP